MLKFAIKGAKPEEVPTTFSLSQAADGQDVFLKAERNSVVSTILAIGPISGTVRRFHGVSTELGLTLAGNNCIVDSTEVRL